jgi:cytochrome P450
MSSGTDDDVAEITLPPNTQIMLNSWACHASSMYFASPETWDPRRWVSPRDGTLLPSTFLYTWGAGPRICPGMKFSQVEFCAVLSSVLCKVRVRGEKEEVLKVLRDSVAEPLLLHVKRPEELHIQVIER